MAEKQRARAADPGSAVDQLGRAITAQDSRSARQVQDIDGRPLRPDRAELVIDDGPRLASPAIWRMARDRWLEVAP